MSTKAYELGKRLSAIRSAHELSLRDVEKLTGVPNATLWRLEHGNPVDYDTGKRIEAFLVQYREPRRWTLQGFHRTGIMTSSHREWDIVYDGPRIEHEERIEVIEVVKKGIAQSGA